MTNKGSWWSMRHTGAWHWSVGPYILGTTLLACICFLGLFPNTHSVAIHAGSEASINTEPAVRIHRGQGCSFDCCINIWIVTTWLKDADMLRVARSPSLPLQINAVSTHRTHKSPMFAVLFHQCHVLANTAWLRCLHFFLIHAEISRVFLFSPFLCTFSLRCFLLLKWKDACRNSLLFNSLSWKDWSTSSLHPAVEKATQRCFGCWEVERHRHVLMS